MPVISSVLPGIAGADITDAGTVMSGAGVSGTALPNSVLPDAVLFGVDGLREEFVTG
jgi:hypothetical protein